jgi:hypothetical protein
MVGIMLWLYTTLKVILYESIPLYFKKAFLIVGAFIFLLSILIYFVAGIAVLAIYLPIVTIGYFLAFNHYYKLLELKVDE